MTSPGERSGTGKALARLKRGDAPWRKPVALLKSMKFEPEDRDGEKDVVAA